MENAHAQNLAQKIAALLEENEKQNGDDLLRSSLEKITQRLDKIESQLAQSNPQSAIPNPRPFHPSQEKFTNLEELADEIFDKLQTEKPCPYEPTAKPCDNCSMCNSRGF